MQPLCELLAIKVYRMVYWEEGESDGGSSRDLTRVCRGYVEVVMQDSDRTGQDRRGGGSGRGKRGDVFRDTHTQHAHTHTHKEEGDEGSVGWR